MPLITVELVGPRLSNISMLTTMTSVSLRGWPRTVLVMFCVRRVATVVGLVRTCYESGLCCACRASRYGGPVAGAAARPHHARRRPYQYHGLATVRCAAD